MLTVKQLADEIGVSKVAINKKIERLGLKSKLTKDGNRYLLDDDIADQVRDAFKYRTEKTDQERQDRQHQEEPTETYTDIIQVLREQLAEKDKQIERLHTLLAQQNQLMLTDGRDGMPQEVQAETVDQGEPQQQHQEEKKSFWSRLFG